MTFRLSITIIVIIAVILPSQIVVAWLPTWQKFPVKASEVKDDWQLVMSKFCGRSCQDGKLVIIDDYCTIPQCFPCDCNEHCSLKGTCCPNVTAESSGGDLRGSYNIENMTVLENYFNGIHARLKCQEVAGPNVGKIVSVTTCPQNWTDVDNETEKCENPTGDSFDSITPYIETNSGLVFGNVFCAMCNGFIPMVPKHDHESNELDEENFRPAGLPPVMPSESSGGHGGGSPLDPGVIPNPDVDITNPHPNMGASWKPSPDMGASLEPNPNIEASWDPNPDMGAFLEPNPDMGASLEPNPDMGFSLDMSTTLEGFVDPMPIAGDEAKPQGLDEEDAEKNNNMPGRDDAENKNEPKSRRKRFLPNPDSVETITSDSELELEIATRPNNALVKPQRPTEFVGTDGKPLKFAKTQGIPDEFIESNPQPPTLTGFEFEKTEPNDFEDKLTPPDTDDGEIVIPPNVHVKPPKLGFGPTGWPDTEPTGVSSFPIPTKFKQTVTSNTDDGGITPPLTINVDSPHPNFVLTSGPDKNWTGTLTGPIVLPVEFKPTLTSNTVTDGEGLMVEDNILVGMEPNPTNVGLAVEAGPNIGAPLGPMPIVGPPLPNMNIDNVEPDFSITAGGPDTESNGGDMSEESSNFKPADTSFDQGGGREGMQPHPPGFEDHRETLETYSYPHPINIEPIPLYIGCEHYQNLYQIRDTFEFYKRAKDLSECVYEFDVTRKMNLTFSMCPTSFIDATELIKAPKCHKKADPTYTDLCLNLPHVPGLLVTKYRNLFCSMCAKKTVNLINNANCAPTSQQDEVRPELFNLRDYEREFHDEPNENCGQNPRNQCVNYRCSDGKTIIWEFEEGRCITAIDKVRGLEYGISATLVSQTGIKNFKLIEVVRAINETLKVRESSYSIRFHKCNRLDDDSSNTLEIDVVGYLKAPWEMSRDMFESDIINQFADNTWNITVEDSSSNFYNLILKPACLGKELCDIYRRKSRVNETCSLLTRWSNTRSNDVTAVTSNPLDITPSLVCSSSSFLQTAEAEATNQTVNFTIEYSNKTRNFLWSSAISVVNGELRLCQYYIDRLIQVDYYGNMFADAPMSNFEYAFGDDYSDGNTTNITNNNNNNSNILHANYFFSFLYIVACCTFLSAY